MALLDTSGGAEAKLRAAGQPRAIRDDLEAMRSQREAEKVKLDLNDEADCSGAERATRAASELRLPESLREAGGLSIDRADPPSASRCRARAAPCAVSPKVSMRAGDVDELVLVGGTSRMARVRSLLQRLLGGREPNCDVSPEEAVAHGTAIQVALTDARRPSPSPRPRHSPLPYHHAHLRSSSQAAILTDRKKVQSAPPRLRCRAPGGRGREMSLVHVPHRRYSYHPSYSHPAALLRPASMPLSLLGLEVPCVASSARGLISARGLGLLTQSGSPP